VRSAKITVAGALALMLLAVVITLARAPLVVIGTNSIADDATAELADGRAGTSACQQAGVVPQGTTAIRVAIEVLAVGPAVTVKVLSGTGVVTEGHEPAGWGVATSATVPVRRVPATLQHARLCIAIGPTVEPFRVRGSPVGPEADVRHLRGIRLQAEYLRPGPRSWWSLASSVAHDIGIGNATGGGWVAFPILALMALVALLAIQLTVRDVAAGERAGGGRGASPARLHPARLRPARRAEEMLRRIPRGALVCALAAFASAACWSLITPPFQVPDEETHFAYTQQLVENMRLPEPTQYAYSPEEQAVLFDLRHEEVRGSPETHTISSLEDQQRLQQTLAQHLSRVPVGVGTAAQYPPLYYLLETIPYVLASPGTLLDQLELMRLFSALLAGVTALFAFMFVRETLPAQRWAWTVGGLGVALAPVLGFMSGADNPDAMLFAVSAAVFYCIARGFRRGLTPGLAAAIGSLIAVGILTKPNFVGLVPGVMLGLLVLAVGRWRTTGPRAAASSLALALLIAASPVCVYALVNLSKGQPLLGSISHSFSTGVGPGSLLEKASYAWQMYLPRLPGMSGYFPGLSTTRLWFERSVGFYGWLDTTFPLSVDTAALVPAGLIGLLCLRTLVGARGVLRARLAELAVYATLVVGVMVLIAAGSYARMSIEGLNFVEPRYLTPLLPLLAAVLALAARGAGRRWGPAAGAAIVMLFLAHDLFSQLLVIGRYYG
jgi:hypothetical protein